MLRVQLKSIVESVFHHFIELSKANKKISTEVAITVGTLNAMRLVDLFEFISRNSSDVRILTQLIHEPEYLNLGKPHRSAE